MLLFRNTSTSMLQGLVQSGIYSLYRKENHEVSLGIVNSTQTDRLVFDIEQHNLSDYTSYILDLDRLPWRANNKYAIAFP